MELLHEIAGSQVREHRELGFRVMMALAVREDNPAWIMEAHHAHWGDLIWLRELNATVRHLETGVAMYDPAIHHDHASLYGGHDTEATGRGARGPQLRAAIGLMKLLGEDARADLSQIYDWFMEGFDTADLKEAKALLTA